MPTNPMQPLGVYRATVSTTAVALPTIPDSATKAVIAFTDATMNWRDDGTDPTSSTGVEMGVGTFLEYEGPLSKIKFIRAGASDGEIHVAYYKPA